MKKLAKAVVAAVLGYQVRRLRRKNDFKIVAVAGSIGKTSTKLAIAQVLRAGFRVRYQQGNYNDPVTVPLIFFGEQEPSLYNPLAWLAVFWRNQKQLGKPYPYDVVVVELGSDKPGDIQKFAAYIEAEIGVVTGITPEHMQFFGTIDEVAKEELSITSFSSLVLINQDLCGEKYLKSLSNLLTYSLERSADFTIKSTGINVSGMSWAEQYSQLAAAAVGAKMGLTRERIKQGLNDVKPFAGRMRNLKGINGSTIIDDSYNASPEAVKLALDSLYQMKAPQKIAVLGSMNEMGAYSKQAHQEVGEYCDPAQLNLVVTIGADAKEFLAPAAESKGCQVKSFDSPYVAGEFLKDQVQKDALILVKGSQNGVFAEEAIKSLLADPADAAQLVRQSAEWLRIKQRSFRA